MQTALTKYSRTRTRAGTLLGLLKCRCSFRASKAKASRCASNSKERRSRTSSLVLAAMSSSSSSSPVPSSSAGSSSPSARTTLSSQPSTSLKVHFTKPKVVPGWKLQSTVSSFSETMSWFLRSGTGLYQKSCSKGRSVELSSLQRATPRAFMPLRALISTPLRGEKASPSVTFVMSMGARRNCRLWRRCPRRGSGRASLFRKSLPSASSLTRLRCFWPSAATLTLACKKTSPLPPPLSEAARRRGSSPSKPSG
mmetsp:Transcript_106686/g.332668  ORF Transcript_106686/g.332668 Transcript_106686/m.332668 type:complete len:253 (+) Transcript_106686:1138-1896(+)